MTTLLQEANNWILAKWFNVVGNGVADDRLALQTLLDTGLSVDLGGDSKVYKINGKLDLGSGHRITGSGATIKQSAVRTEIFNFDNKVDIKISGVKFLGLGTDFNDSPGSLAIALRGWYASDIHVNGCEFTNFTNTSLSIAYASNISFTKNKVTGPGASVLTPVTSGACYGVVIDAGCSNILVSGNEISETAQGVTTGDGCIDMRVIGNNVHDIIGQHGMYFGSGHVNLTVLGNTINGTSLQGIKVQNFDTPALHAINIVVGSNTICNTGSHGISILSTTPNPVYKLTNVTVHHNVIDACGEDGIEMYNTINGSVDHNKINGALRTGIAVSASDRILVDGNVIYDTQNSAIREVLASTNVTISGNKIINGAQGLVTGDGSGILVVAGSYWNITNNSIIDGNAKMKYGIFIEGGTQTSMIVNDNFVTGATDYGARFISPVVAMVSYSRNSFSGTIGDVANEPLSPQIAQQYIAGLQLDTTSTGAFVGVGNDTASVFESWNTVTAPDEKQYEVRHNGSAIEIRNARSYIDILSENIKSASFYKDGSTLYFKTTGVAGTDASHLIVKSQLDAKIAAAQADSTATDVAGLLADFNALLAKMRAGTLLTP